MQKNIWLLGFPFSAAAAAPIRIISAVSAVHWKDRLFPSRKQSGFVPCAPVPGMWSFPMRLFSAHVSPRLTTKIWQMRWRKKMWKPLWTLPWSRQTRVLRSFMSIWACRMWRKLSCCPPLSGKCRVSLTCRCSWIPVIRQHWKLPCAAITVRRWYPFPPIRTA